MEFTRRLFMGGLAAAGLSAGTRATEAVQAPPDLSHLTPEQRAKYEAMHARMMAALTYERVTVAREHALAEWERLKGAGRGWPVVIGGDEDLERIADQFSITDSVVAGVALPGMSVRSPAQILAAAGNIHFPHDLRKWSGAYQPEDLCAPLGEWPTKVDDSGPGLSVALDLVSGKVHDRVHILLLPTKKLGSACLSPMGRLERLPAPRIPRRGATDWQHRFGAELVGINGDTMNVRARTRPKDREQSLRLARDLYGYCPDIVDQGVGSIAALAAGLMASDWWYLWWD